MTLFSSWLPTTICGLLIPFALRLLPMFRNPSNSSHLHPRPPLAPAPTPLRTPISALLTLYILYTLYTLAFARPPNLFTALRLPLNAPQSTIHSALLLQHLQQLRPDNRQSSSSSSAAAVNGSTAVPVLPPALEKLLARLASSDARTILVRYGQRTVQTCSHCVTEADYALHALPPALLSYTLAAVMLGAVTVRGTARESRRTIALMFLVFAALVEAYWAYTVPIRIPSRQKQQNSSGDETIMWHDTLWSLRHALFLSLPLTIHLLPAPPPTPNLTTTLTHLSKTADSQLTSLHFLRLSTTAIQRVPELRTRATAFWTRERSVGAAVRRDADVRETAERMGLGIKPSEERTLLGSRDYAEAQKRAAGVAGPDVGGGGGEGTLHRAARGAVAALKEAVLRPPLPSGGVQ